MSDDPTNETGLKSYKSHPTTSAGIKGHDAIAHLQASTVLQPKSSLLPSIQIRTLDAKSLIVASSPSTEHLYARESPQSKTSYATSTFQFSANGSARSRWRHGPKKTISCVGDSSYADTSRTELLGRKGDKVPQEMRSLSKEMI